MFCLLLSPAWETEMRIATQTAIDPLQALADKLRTRKGIEYSDAKLALPNGGYRVEYVRGKDFARYFRQQPEMTDFVDSGL